VATFEAVGPAFALDGPPPVAPPHSLLQVEGVVVERDATRVLNGVNVWAYPTGCSSLWEPCSGGTFRVKASDSNQPSSRFDSFVVYKTVTCSTIGLRDPQELADRAAAVLDATLSAAVERALAEGVDQSSNPFFGDATVDDLTGGTGVSTRVALAMLEEAIGDTCRQGMIHLTPAVLSASTTEPVDMSPAADFGPLLTINGTPVVSGMGYQNIDTPYLDTPGATEDWAFATGPPRVYLGPVVLTSVRDSVETATNVLTFRAERYVLAIWDGTLQAAALVDWST
jgi:hypothetical protein